MEISESKSRLDKLEERLDNLKEPVKTVNKVGRLAKKVIDLGLESDTDKIQALKLYIIKFTIAGVIGLLAMFISSLF